MDDKLRRVLEAAMEMYRDDGFNTIGISRYTLSNKCGIAEKVIDEIMVILAEKNYIRPIYSGKNKNFSFLKLLDKESVIRYLKDNDGKNKDNSQELLKNIMEEINHLKSKYEALLNVMKGKDIFTEKEYEELLR